jgi:hypothetical protein
MNTNDARRLADELRRKNVVYDGEMMLTDYHSRQLVDCLETLADEVDRLRAEVARVKQPTADTVQWEDRVTDALGGKKDGVSYGD